MIATTSTRRGAVESIAGVVNREFVDALQRRRDAPVESELRQFTITAWDSSNSVDVCFPEGVCLTIVEKVITAGTF
ncbi:MAG TPA: hypothetical protein VK565_03050, partial [Gemmatimonadaceae bacterium]|nr:hypothetical protein [Gemmatimonadaceae bacterium]